VSPWRRLKQGIGRRIIPRLPLTRHVFNHLRLEMSAMWVRANYAVNPMMAARRRSIRAAGGLSVNVGCGPFGKSGWLNLDLMPVPGVTLQYDCRKSLPLRDGSAARIRCEHFFEHLDHEEEAPLFLAACFRSLAPKGVLRVVVPDAGRYLKAYCSGSREAWSDLGWDIGHLPPPLNTPMAVINHVFRQGEEHRYAYDFETLAGLLRDSGFQVIPSAFGHSVDPQLCDDLPNHRLYSLYVDAVKQ
jgi:predicted SAM-dependent methyltransferase